MSSGFEEEHRWKVLILATVVAASDISIRWCFEWVACNWPQLLLIFWIEIFYFRSVKIDRYIAHVLILLRSWVKRIQNVHADELRQCFSICLIQFEQLENELSFLKYQVFGLVFNSIDLFVYINLNRKRKTDIKKYRTKFIVFTFSVDSSPHKQKSPNFCKSESSRQFPFPRHIFEPTVLNRKSNQNSWYRSETSYQHSSISTHTHNQN